MSTKWKIVKLAVGLLSIYLDKRLRRQRPTRALDIVAVDAAMSLTLKTPEEGSFTSKDRKAYAKVLSHAVYWHGTGAKQYEGGRVFNVFDKVLEHGELRPFKDIFDVKYGEMNSTSVTWHRMYARIYADMHAYKGVDAGSRYGSPRFWAYYFIIAINMHAVRELRLWKRAVRRRQVALWRNQGRKLWIVKVTKHDESSVGRFFNAGSDIAGNYPILIGLKQVNYTELSTAAYVARHERRIASGIPVTAWSHIEVPASKIGEVAGLLQKHGYGDIPVFAIEQCEHFASDKRFSELVRPLLLTD